MRKALSGQENENICEMCVWVFGRACQASSTELVASALAPALASALTSLLILTHVEGDRRRWWGSSCLCWHVK